MFQHIEQVEENVFASRKPDADYSESRLEEEEYFMIKRVEVNYRGIFQKNLGKKIGSDIVMIASRMGQKAFSNGRYSDSPERNGIPCKYFAFVSPDLRRGGIGSGVRRQA